MSTGKVVLGLVAGFAAGALAGVLFAPAKGSKTRKRIVRKGEDYVDSMKDQMDELLESVTNKFDKVKSEVVDFADKKMDRVKESEKNVR
jgi:gas vesicle protein